MTPATKEHVANEVTRIVDNFPDDADENVRAGFIGVLIASLFVGYSSIDMVRAMVKVDAAYSHVRKDKPELIPIKKRKEIN